MHRVGFVALPLFLLCAIALAGEQPESYWRKYHRGMKEPSLRSGKLRDDEFAFRWTRLSNSGEPLAIRIWCHDGETRCRSVRLAYRLDFSIGPITADKTTKLSPSQNRELRSYLSRHDLWCALSPQEQAMQNRFLGGAHWLFEVEDRSGYRFVSLFSPALLTASSRSKDTLRGMRNVEGYLSLATFLLRLTRVFPDETQVAY
jgi:hypothetical protein